MLFAGLVVLHVTSGIAQAQPAHDNFANAIVLSGPAGSVTGSNVSATGEAGEPSTGFNLTLNSVWYSWVAATSGPATFETCGGITDYDTHLAVFTGSAVNALTTIGFNDDDCGLLSRVTFTATSGTTYYIQIDGFSTAQGNFTLTYPAGAVATVSTTQAQTTRAIARFLKRRNDRLLSAAPDGQRQIGRLRAADEEQRDEGVPHGVTQNLKEAGNGVAAKSVPKAYGMRGSAAFAHPGKAPHAAQTIAPGGASLSFAASLSNARKQEAIAERRRLVKLLGQSKYSALGAGNFVSQYSRPPSFDIWVEGRYTYFEDGSAGSEGSGHFGVVHVGADYVVNTSLLLGAQFQFDDSTESSNTLATDIDGKGWMIGPYATAKLARNIYAQGRFAWGQSRNDITVGGASGRFDTERWLVSGAIQGNWRQGAWRFTPSVSVAHIRERQKAYVDSNGTAIPGQSAASGQAEFGPEVSYTVRKSDDTLWVPRAAFRGIWTFSQETDGTVAGATVVGDGLRGKAELGLRVVETNGSSLDVTGAYDGVGDRDFSAYSGSVRLRLRY